MPTNTKPGVLYIEATLDIDRGALLPYTAKQSNIVSKIHVLSQGLNLMIKDMTFGTSEINVKIQEYDTLKAAKTSCNFIKELEFHEGYFFLHAFPHETSTDNLKRLHHHIESVYKDYLERLKNNGFVHRDEIYGVNEAIIKEFIDNISEEKNQNND